MAYADHVLVDGRKVGWSSGTIYSPHYREFLSHGCIDVTEAEVGREVVVKWGDHGGPITDIRATVERFPYLAEGRNDKIDVSSLPG
jgi:vanillate/3-O-methylgallate O-demethylase